MVMLGLLLSFVMCSCPSPALPSNTSAMTLRKVAMAATSLDTHRPSLQSSFPARHRRLHSCPVTTAWPTTLISPSPFLHPASSNFSRPSCRRTATCRPRPCRTIHRPLYRPRQRPRRRLQCLRAFFVPEARACRLVLVTTAAPRPPSLPSLPLAPNARSRLRRLSTSIRHPMVPRARTLVLKHIKMMTRTASRRPRCVYSLVKNRVPPVNSPRRQRRRRRHPTLSRSRLVIGTRAGWAGASTSRHLLASLRRVDTALLR